MLPTLMPKNCRDGAVTSGSATLADYRRSGYDRGHLAPAAAMAWSQEVMSESFYLSNMGPQDPGFNRGIWRQLEARVRDWADLHGEVFVVTGPVLEGELPTIGSSGMSVPEYFYKVIVDLRLPGYAGIGFILPNRSVDQSIEHFAVEIDSVEADRLVAGRTNPSCPTTSPTASILSSEVLWPPKHYSLPWLPISTRISCTTAPSACRPFYTPPSMPG